MRSVLAFYPRAFLEGLLFISAALVIVFYALYSALGVTSAIAVYSTLPVVAAVLRYLQLAFQSGEAEYPEKLLFKDPGLLVYAFIWALAMFAVFYWPL